MGIQLLYMVECERSLVYTYLVCTEPTCTWDIYVFNIYTDVYTHCIHNCSIYNCVLFIMHVSSAKATSTFNIHRKEESEPCTVCGT